MTDSPRRDGGDPNQPPGAGYPRYTDPAYAEQAPPYGSAYQQPQGYDPTQRLSPYHQYGYDPYGTGQYGAGYPGYAQEDPQSPGGGSKLPMWLWILAAVVVLLVIGLVIALVITNSSRQQTVLAPAPAPLEPTATATAPRPTTTTRLPTPVVPSVPSEQTTPPTTPFPSATAPSTSTETVEYNVIGQGRVINITYTATGGVPQTEFNVALPWSKSVELPSPAESSARISIINVGRDVTCSVTIDGVKVEQSTGSGLTYCVGTG